MTEWMTADTLPTQADADEFGNVLLATYTRDWGGNWVCRLATVAEVGYLMQSSDELRDRRRWARSGLKVPEGVPKLKPLEWSSWVEESP